MAGKPRITRDDIVAAALSVLRRGGLDAVNARNIAAELGCSTQPIYHAFRNMDEVRAELTRRAIHEHTERITRSVRHNGGTRGRYCDYGVGFVRFAEQEKQLFRWLYLERGQGDGWLSDVHLEEIIAVIRSEYGYTEEVARALHRDMTFYSWGLAALAYTGALTLSDEELLAALRREFAALSAVWGAPPARQNTLPDAKPAPAADAGLSESKRSL